MAENRFVGDDDDGVDDDVNEYKDDTDLVCVSPIHFSQLVVCLMAAELSVMCTSVQQSTLSPFEQFWNVQNTAMILS